MGAGGRGYDLTSIQMIVDNYEAVEDAVKSSEESREEILNCPFISDVQISIVRGFYDYYIWHDILTENLNEIKTLLQKTNSNAFWGQDGQNHFKNVEDICEEIKEDLMHAEGMQNRTIERTIEGYNKKLGQLKELAKEKQEKNQEPEPQPSPTPTPSPSPTPTPTYTSSSGQTHGGSGRDI